MLLVALWGAFSHIIQNSHSHQFIVSNIRTFPKSVVIELALCAELMLAYFQTQLLRESYIE